MNAAVPRSALLRHGRPGLVVLMGLITTFALLVGGAAPAKAQAVTESRTLLETWWSSDVAPTKTLDSYAEVNLGVVTMGVCKWRWDRAVYEMGRYEIVGVINGYEAYRHQTTERTGNTDHWTWFEDEYWCSP